MRIDTAKLGVVQNQYFPSSMHHSNLELLTNMAPKPDVDTFEFSPKTEENFLTYGLNVGKENQTYGGDDPFSEYSDAQHLVFTQKLQDMGVFDGKSEEINKMKDLLFNITSMMSCVGEDKLGIPHVDTGGTDRYDCYEKYDESLYGITSDVAKVGLESAKAALEEFSKKYLTQEQQGEFSGLIDEFYHHNSEYLKEYRAFGEDVEKFAAIFQKSGLRDIFDQKGLIGIHEMFENEEDEYTKMLTNMKNHMQEETDSYIRNLSNMFQLMQQPGSDFADIWNKINSQVKDPIFSQSAGAFAHMEGYWSALQQG